jgi:molecular chaperone GrpE
MKNQDNTPNEELPKEQEAPLEENNTDSAIVILREEIDSLNDRLLRNAAETENMRKRYEKQLEEAKLYSISNFAKDLLSVSDNLSRALEHKPVEMTKEVANIIQGVEMTRQEMINIFVKYKMKEISPSAGEKFDYNLHYAVTQIPSSEYPAGTILQLVQYGYMIGDRLLRPATVTVTKALE